MKKVCGRPNVSAEWKIESAVPILTERVKKLEIQIKKLTKTRLNDRTSGSWKSLKELKKKKLQLKDKINKLI